MHSAIAYLLAAAAGVVMAHYLSRAPELRSLRLAQFVFVPPGLALCVFFLPEPGLPPNVAQFVSFLAVLFFLIVLLVPNIAFHCGAALSNFLYPHDWTPLQEEIALRPIRRLIDNDDYPQALADLDELLEKHPPTYEALLIKTKLLYHFGSADETRTTLLRLIGLSQTTAQQLAVMEMLAHLEEHPPAPPRPLVPGQRRVEIHHELILFPIADETAGRHKVIPPGAHEVEETFHRHHCWLKLAGEDWGNAEMCWEAIREIPLPPALPLERGFVWRIAHFLQKVTFILKGKPRIQRQAEGQKLFQEAKQHIRREEWKLALPLLQKASACDPDCYEFAYRWVQAVRRTADDAVTARAVNQALNQSQWTEYEQQMLLKLKRSG